MRAVLPSLIPRRRLLVLRWWHRQGTLGSLVSRFEDEGTKNERTNPVAVQRVLFVRLFFVCFFVRLFVLSTGRYQTLGWLVVHNSHVKSSITAWAQG